MLGDVSKREKKKVNCCFIGNVIERHGGRGKGRRRKVRCR
jgi:hypothetical protein